MVRNGETGKTQKVNTLITARNFPTMLVTAAAFEFMGHFSNYDG
jgi:hypothetical protein